MKRKVICMDYDPEICDEIGCYHKTWHFETERCNLSHCGHRKIENSRCMDSSYPQISKDIRKILELV